MEVEREEYKPKIRLDTNLLWIPPYDRLRLLTRTWFSVFREQQLLSQFEKSPLLKSYLEENPTFRDWVYDRSIKSLEFRTQIETSIEEIVSSLKEWKEWAAYVPGVGRLSLGKLLGIIGNPAARAYVSNLWSYCGFAVKDGKLVKYTKGEQGQYNSLAKSQVWIIVTNILKVYPKSPSFYGLYYYVWKEKFAQKHPDWAPIRVHLSAIIKTGKFFLSHLWAVCRRLQGLPAPKPYQFEFLGHQTYIPPEIALSPFKKERRVLQAIKEVEYLLKIEPEEEVVSVVTSLMEQLKGFVSVSEERKPRKRRRRRKEER